MDAYIITIAEKCIERLEAGNLGRCVYADGLFKTFKEPLPENMPFPFENYNGYRVAKEYDVHTDDYVVGVSK